MRKLIFLLLVMLGILPAYSQLYPHKNVVTEEMAYEAVVNELTNLNVDIYLKQEYNLRHWVFFVDCEPMKGWEHDGLLFKVPKTITTSASDLKVYIDEVTTLRLFPEGDFTIKYTMPRASIDIYHKPMVQESVPNENATPGSRTKAIILSGGVDKGNNFFRYWNDCSFIYQTLTKRYNIPKENIVPIMADGDNPEEDTKYYDMSTRQVWFGSQNLDLDDDGIDEIQYAATRDNIQSVLNDMINTMNEDDHLFFYVIDHGGTDDFAGNSFIYLWGKETLYDYELAQWLTPFTDKGVNVNAVLGQCYSGGFVDDLTMAGCVVATASSESQSSWACTDIPYDEFVYHWTAGINGWDAFGNPTVADADENGFISMYEAFKYAEKNDRRIKYEKPKFQSNPYSIGVDLAFNNIPSGTDLYIRDNEGDLGVEPNTTSEITWDSPDIWIRNKLDDHGTEHENPVYTETHVTVKVYVRVHNRGKNDYVINNDNDDRTKYLHLYWAKASTGLTKEAWLGGERYNNRVTGGAICPPVHIPSIPAGESVVLAANWTLSDDLFTFKVDENPENHHFCLLAKIKDDHYAESFYDTLIFEPVSSKRIAQKNLTILEDDNSGLEALVFVRNVKNTNKSYSLEVRERNNPLMLSSGLIYQAADIQLTMSDKVYSGWVRGGMRVQGMNQPTSSAPKTFRFSSNEDKIQAISLQPSEFDKVNIRLLPKSDRVPDGRTYIFDLIQRDENGVIIGGESFKYTEPDNTIYIPIDPPIIVADPAYGNKMILNAKIPQGYSDIRWQDEKGDVLGEENSLIVPNENQIKLFTVSAASEDGRRAYGSIDVSNVNRIKTFSLSNGGITLDLVFEAALDPQKNEIIISSIDNSAIPAKTVVPAEVCDNISINIENCQSGNYAVALKSNGKTVHTIKFNKK